MDKQELREAVQEGVREGLRNVVKTSPGTQLAQALGEGVLWGAGLALALYAAGNLIQAFQQSKQTDAPEE